MSVKMIPVKSSNIAEIGYDKTNKIVYVKFLNDTKYIYKGVPQNKFDNLLQAPSVGSYFNRNFKNCYVYERIE